MGGTKKQKTFIFSFIAAIGLTLLVVFQNCSGPAPIEFSTVSSLSALPAEVEIESLPALPEVGSRAVLQPIFYRTEKNLRDWNSLTYQWFLDGKPLPTQKSVQIVFEPLQAKDLGKYNIEIKSDTGVVLSGSFHLSGSDSNRVLPETASITYSPSKPFKDSIVELSLNRNGDKDWTYFEYQWLKASSPVPNAVGPSLTITSLQASDEGGYTLKLTDPQDRTKNIYSNQIPLTIFDPSRQLPDEVQITINPNPAKVGDTVTLSTSFPKDTHLNPLRAGMGPEQYYSFQWLCKQRTCTSTSSTASLDKITMADAGNYQVKVSLLSNRATEKTFGPTELQVDPVGCTADSDGNTGSRTVYVLATASSATDCNNAKVTQNRTCGSNDTWGAWTPAYPSGVHINCNVGTSGTLTPTCTNDGYGTTRVVYTSNGGDCGAAYRQQARSCGANGWSLWTPSVPDPVFPTCNSTAQPKTCSAPAPTRTVYTAQFAPDCNASTVKISQTGVCNTNTGTYDTWTPAAGAELSGCTNSNPCTGLNGSLIYGDENRVAYTALSASNCDNVKTSQKRTCNTNNLTSGIWGDWTPSNYVPNCTPLAINANLSSSQTTCTIANGDSTCTLPLNISVQNIPTGSYVYISRTYQDSSSASQNNTAAVETNWVSSLSITRSFTLANGTNVFALKESSTSSSFTEKASLGSSIIVTAGCGSSSSWSSSTQKCQANAAPVSVPACTLSANPATVVAGGTSVLSASCTPAATSYDWSGSSTTCASGLATCTVTSSATTVYSVIGINSSGRGTPGQAPVQVSALTATLAPNSLTCTIAANASECTVNATASFQNTPANGLTVVLTRQPSGGTQTTLENWQQTSSTSSVQKTLTVPFGPHIFSLYQGSSSGSLLATSSQITASCAQGSWNSTSKKCEISANLACSIGLGSGSIAGTVGSTSCTCSSSTGLTAPACPTSVAAGTTVSFTATPAFGSTFFQWKNCPVVSYSNVCAFTTTSTSGNISLVGEFQSIQTATNPQCNRTHNGAGTGTSVQDIIGLDCFNGQMNETTLNISNNDNPQILITNGYLGHLTISNARATTVNVYFQNMKPDDEFLFFERQQDGNKVRLILKNKSNENGPTRSLYFSFPNRTPDWSKFKIINATWSATLKEIFEVTSNSIVAYTYPQSNPNNSSSTASDVLGGSELLRTASQKGLMANKRLTILGGTGNDTYVLAAPVFQSHANEMNNYIHIDDSTGSNIIHLMLNTGFNGLNPKIACKATTGTPSTKAIDIKDNNSNTYSIMTPENFTYRIDNSLTTYSFQELMNRYNFTCITQQ